MFQGIEGSDSESSSDLAELLDVPAKRGRPKGAYGNVHTRNLNPQERRVVHLRAAECTLGFIALQLETNEQQVRNILARPHVASYLTKLDVDIASELAPVARDLTLEMEAISAEAFDRLTSNMRSLDEIGEDACAAGDLKNGIRAKLGCVATTQDILDRAGKRAPTRTIGAMIHAVPTEQLDKLERILGDVLGQAR